EDAADFFGREVLVKRLLSRLENDHTLSSFLAIVGPSGSGKSSVVRAGLIPALRAGALHGSEDWFIVEMVPSNDPLRELEDALTRIALRPVHDLHERLRTSEKALGEIVEEILPPGENELLLFIDQFEEFFTLTDETHRLSFLKSLYEAVISPRTRLRIVITLRADFYDRPLMVAGFSRLIQQRTEVVVPLTSRELAKAIVEPANNVGVYFERGLPATIVSEVNEEAGILPMLQYALTELFNQRDARLISIQVYQELGGVSGALARRAEELYLNLDDESQENTRQMFLRLVTPGEGVEDTRRRTLVSELIAAAPMLNMQGVIDLFGDHRLITFDRDPQTREPTVEVAHEALIRGWWRFRRWMDDGRDDVRLQRLLSTRAGEWYKSDYDEGLLLTGSRLSQLEEWAERRAIGLTDLDTLYLTDSIQARFERERREQVRRENELMLERRARQRLRSIVAILTVSIVVGAILLLGIFQQSIAAGFARDDAENQALTAVAAGDFAVTQQNIAVIQANNANTQAAAANTARADEQRQVALVSTEQFNVRVEATKVSEAQATAEFNANAALNAGATAQGNLKLALTARFEAQNAEATAQGNFEVALTAQSDALDAEAEAQNEANRASTAEFDALAAEADALSAQADAEVNLELALTAQAVALDAEAEAENEAEISRSLALAASADRLVNQDSPLALALALEANRVENPSLQAQRVLLSVAFDAPRSQFTDVLETVTALEFLPILTDSDFQTEAMVLIADAAGKMQLKNILSGEIVRTYPGTLEIRHTDRINSIAIHPDGTQILTTSEDGTLILWNLASGEPAQQFVGHTAAINDARFNTAGNQIVSGSDDATVRVWNTFTGDNTQILPTISANAVNSVAFRPGRADIVIASEDALRYWDANRSRYEDFAELANRTQDIVFTPDGNRLLTSGSGTGGIPELWDIETREKIRTLPAHLGPVNDIAISPDGRLALSASDDFVVILSNIITGAELQRFTGHNNRVNAVAFSHDSRFVLSGAADRLLYLWDVAPRTQTEQRYEGLDTSISYLDYLPGGWIFSGTDRGTIALWQEDSSETVFDGLLYQPGLPVTAYDLHQLPDDSWRILSGSSDMRLFEVIPDLETGNLQTRQLRRIAMPEAQSWVQTVAFSPDGQLMVSGGGYFYRDRLPDFTRLGLLRLWDTETGELVHELDAIDELTLTATDGSEEVILPEGANTSITAVAFHPDGRRLVSGAEDGRIILWNILTGERLQEFTGHTDIVTSLVFTLDGTGILSGSADRAAILWRLSDGEQLRRFTGHTDTVNDVAFSPGTVRNTIITASEDRTLRLWDTDTGELIQRFGVQDVPVTRVLFTGEDNTALLGTLDGSVFIDNIDTAANLLQWVQENRYVPELTCSQREQFRIQPLCAASTASN
ncbi:MAG: NACHT and WD repeat domain-containing protein, partial [Aggregatilineales bacterium]